MTLDTIFASTRSDSVPSSTAPIASREEAVRRARAMIPALRAEAGRTDRDRHVPDDQVAALHDNGLFGVMTPRRFGGSELGLAALVEVAAALAEGCGSTAWIYSVLGGHNWMTALFPAEAQEEVFADPSSLVASVVRLGGPRPRRVSGGFRITDGVGKFCSGIYHSNWVMVGAHVEGADGAIEPHYLLVSKDEVEVADDWHTVGMRGTGSKAIAIRDAFVPEHRGLPVARMIAGTAPGAILHDAPIYRGPFPHALTFTLAGVPVGIARAAVRAFSEAYARKLGGFGEGQVSEESATMVRLATADAQIEAAAALLFDQARAVDGLVDSSALPLVERTRYMRDIAFVGGQCRAAVNDLFQIAGGSAIYESNELQRLWRDANACTGHLAFSQERAGAMHARAMLGFPQSKFTNVGH